MSYNKFIIQLSHGGRFIPEPVLYYIEGKISFFHDVDPDRMSYFELKSMIEDLGYTNITKMHFRVPCTSLEVGLRCIVSDHHIATMIDASRMTRVIEVYSEHDEPIDNILSSLPLENSEHHKPNENSSLPLENSEHQQPNENSSLPLENNEHQQPNENSSLPLENIEHQQPNENIDLAMNDEPNNVPLGEHNESSESDGYYSESGDEEDSSESSSVELNLSDIDDELVEVRKKKLEMRKKSTMPQTQPSSSNPQPPQTQPSSSSNPQPDIYGGFVSDYADSYNYDSPDSNDEDGRRKTSSFPVFDTKMNMYKVEPVVGMKFCTRKDLKKCISDYAIARGYPIKYKRNAKRRITAVCADGCPWRLHASYMQMEETLQIKTMTNVHKCVREFKIKMANSAWLSKMYFKKITANPAWKLKEFKSDVLEKYAIDVTLSQCYRAKKKALCEVENSLQDHYAKLWDYGVELRRSNPDSTVRFEVERLVPSEPAHFKRMYICFDAIKKGWLEGCRPVIGIDGCFLKSYCKGELLTAVGRDGNNQMFPIAWAVVEVECKDSWTWFLQLLLKDVGIIGGSGWTIISDQQKGLESAIKDLIPFAEHRCCARHIYANFRKRFSGTEYKSYFWAACKCGTPEEFNRVMSELRQLESKAYDYLMDQNPQTWARAFFKTDAYCDAVENNGYILEAREKPIIQMLEDIRISLMVRMQKKREIISKWEDSLCPRIREVFERNKMEHRHWGLVYNGNNKFEVRQGLVGCLLQKEDPETYVAKWFKTEKCLTAYNHYLQPVNGEGMWPTTWYEIFLPPLGRRMPGRPKKQRNKEFHELQGGSSQLSRKGRHMQCQQCKQYGHNKKTCRGPVHPLQNVRRATGTGSGQHSSNASGSGTVRRSTGRGSGSGSTSANQPPRPRGRPRGSGTSRGRGRGIINETATVPQSISTRGRGRGNTNEEAAAVPQATSTRGRGKGIRGRGRGRPRKEQIPHGYRLYVSPTTGDSYISMPSTSAPMPPIHLSNPPPSTPKRGKTQQSNRTTTPSTPLGNNTSEVANTRTSPRLAAKRARLG